MVCTRCGMIGAGLIAALCVRNATGNALASAGRPVRAGYAGRIRQEARELKQRRAEIAVRIEQHQKGEGISVPRWRADFTGFPRCRAIRAFENRAKAPTPRLCVFEPTAQRKKARVFTAFAIRSDSQSGELFELAGGLGFEPRLTESESAVLPLNYPPGGAARRRPSAAHARDRAARRASHLGHLRKISKTEASAVPPKA